MTNVCEQGQGRNHIEEAVQDRQLEENPCGCRQLESAAQQNLNPGTQTLDILWAPYVTTLT